MSQECRAITALHPVLRHLAQTLLDTAHAQGIPLALGETYRSVERQDYLYAQGRTRPGSIVTYAEGYKLSSYHQWGLAFDVFINQKGKEYDTALLAKVGQLGKAIGLEWGGDWLNFKDTPHFQYTEGISVNSLKAGRQLQTLLIQIDGTIKPVKGIQVEGYNYVKLQDLRSPHLQVGYDEKQKVPTLVTL